MDWENWKTHLKKALLQDLPAEVEHIFLVCFVYIPAFMLWYVFIHFLLGRPLL